MANIGYVCVSTAEQNSGKQFVLFKKHGIKFDKVYEEQVSGKDVKGRPQLKAMMESVRKGDIVYIESISRLARNIMDLIKIVQKLQDKKVEFVSFKETIDTSTHQGKFLLSIFGALAELERKTIKQRQREGIDLALAQGRVFGRPKVQMSPTFPQNYKDWKAKKINGVEFRTLEGLKKSTFYKLVKEYETKRDKK